MSRKALALPAAMFAVALATAPVHAGVDPLAARVRTEDADRFVALFEAAGGAPTAEQLRAGYLEPGSRGVEIFTPHRIRDAEHLAARIAASPDAYRRAIDVCLPIAKESSAELRATYLALQGLLGDPELPEIYALFGAGNSGGTTGPGAQVLGLEVLCRIADSEEEIRGLFRQFFAHETVHTLQRRPSKEAESADLLLTWALSEGVADFVATLVTGRVPHPDRAAWASEREAEVWGAFAADRRAVQAMRAEERASREAGSAVYRWVANASSPPEGWPGELGYWIGMKIAEGYYERSADKRGAVRELLSWEDASTILAASGYADWLAPAVEPARATD